jgi:pimeloyl-ACP methyl ester carboxylesterase
MDHSIPKAGSDQNRADRGATFLLVHGSWHHGGLWTAVRHCLDSAGVPSLAPTLAGHGPGDERRGVTHDDYVDSVLAALDAESAPVTLVGHSLGGSVVSRVAELRPELCRSLVYYAAFVPRDGESVAEALPRTMIELFDQMAASSKDDSCSLPYAQFRSAFVNTADEAAAKAIHPHLVPEPRGPIFETLTLPGLRRFEIPTAYIHCRDDRSLPPGTFHPGQSKRLKNPKVLEIDGDHEALLTAPERLARALLAA